MVPCRAFAGGKLAVLNGGLGTLLAARVFGEVEDLKGEETALRGRKLQEENGGGLVTEATVVKTVSNAVCGVLSM